MPSILEFQDYPDFFGAHLMKLFLIAFSAVAFVMFYLAIVRPILVHSVVLSPVFKEEAALFDQLRAKLAGLKTRLAARFVMLSGLLVALYDSLVPIVSGVDTTPLTKDLPSWVLPLGLILIGWLFSYLRHVTEHPPQVVTQKMEDGTVQVVALNKPEA